MATESGSSSGKAFKNFAADKVSPAAYLSAGSEVVGDVVFNGPATLSGKVEGSIVSKYRLEVDEGAQISASIEGSEIIVKGVVKGNITASEHLLLLHPGKVLGDVKCASIQIEDGAIFEGKCAMTKKTVTKNVTTKKTNTKK